MSYSAGSDPTANPLLAAGGGLVPSPVSPEVATGAAAMAPASTAPALPRSLQELEAIRSAIAPQAGYRYGTVLPLKTPVDAQGNPNGAPSLAIPSAGRQLVEGLLDNLEGPYTGKMTPEGTMALAGSGLAGGALAGPADSTAGMFVGLRGADNLERSGVSDRLVNRIMDASTAAAGGAKNPDLWEQYKTYLGPDRYYRTEIPDVTAEINHLAIANNPVGNEFASVRPGTTLGQLILNGDTGGQYPLFKLYPDMADIPVQMLKRGSGGASSISGSYTRPGQGVSETIKLAASPVDDMLDTLLHEMQHGVQHREGFSPGTSQSAFISNATRREAQRLEAQRDVIKRQLYDKGADDAASAMDALREHFTTQGGAPLEPLLANYAKLHHNILSDMFSRENNLLRIGGVADRLYKQNFGESEASNVEYRRYMGDTQQAQSPPWETMAWPERQYIGFESVPADWWKRGFDMPHVIGDWRPIL